MQVFQQKKLLHIYRVAISVCCAARNWSLTVDKVRNNYMEEISAYERKHLAGNVQIATAGKAIFNTYTYSK